MTDPRTDHQRLLDRIALLEWHVGLGFYAVLTKLDQLTHQGEHEMADLTALTAEVAENTNAVASASALLSELSALITEAGTDPTALAEITAALDANNQALAEAVTANTPAAAEQPPATTPPVEPTPAPEFPNQ